MPFVSNAQRRFMYAKHPELAKEFQAATPKGKKLPEHVAKRQRQNRAHSAFMKGMSKGGY